MSSPEKRLIERISSLTCTVSKPHATTDATVTVGTYRCAIQPQDGNRFFKLYIPQEVDISKSWLIAVGSDEYRVSEVADNGGMNRVTRCVIEERAKSSMTFKTATASRNAAGDITRTWASSFARFGFLVEGIGEMKDPLKTQYDAIAYVARTPSVAATIVPTMTITIGSTVYQILSVNDDEIYLRRNP